MYSCDQNNKVCSRKAQNPYTRVYFHTHKCTGNTGHSSPDQSMKANFIEFVTVYYLFKESGVKGITDY